MPRDEQEFLSYIARHFRLVELLCSHVKGFESDSELHSFLDANSDGAESTSRQAKRLKDVGVLIEGASGWIAFPFLSHFLRQLHDRHLLASPMVVRGWIKELQNHSSRLASHIEQASSVPNLRFAVLLGNCNFLDASGNELPDFKKIIGP